MILSPKTIGEGVFRCTWPVLGYAEHSLNVFGNDLKLRHSNRSARRNQALFKDEFRRAFYSASERSARECNRSMVIASIG